MSMAKFLRLTRTQQLDREWVESELFPLAESLRQKDNVGQSLSRRSLYLLFYEPSFLTRTSFERAMGLLGGTPYVTEDAGQFFPVNSPAYIENIIANLAAMHMDMVVLRSSDQGVMDRAETEADAQSMPLINGGSIDDHPTQALTDLYTLKREIGAIDGTRVAVVGRLDHRNVSAFLQGLAMYKGVTIIQIPFSGQADPDVISECERRGVTFESGTLESVSEVDAIYLNGPRTLAHVQLLKSRGTFNLRIDEKFMAKLKPTCVILDPMQRSGDFEVLVSDNRLANYRQAENALFIRMALLQTMLG
jgi:aspartate carbamoyltransferase catalytic subunit